MSTSSTGERRDVLIIGAGPAGLAAAVAVHKAGLDYEVLDKGVLVNSIFHFPVSMTFFTTPELLEIGGLPFVSPYEKPTRAEALRYYRRVTDTHGLRVLLGEEVRAIHPEAGGSAPAFRLETLAASRVHHRRTRCVVVATGYYDHPNRLEVPGENLPHVSHYYREAHAFYRKRLVITGGKNSAAIAALETWRAGAASVTLVHRGPRLSDSVKYWIRPDLENRLAEGAIAARWSARVTEIRPDEVVLETPAGRETLPADAVLLLTGYHPDVELLRGAGVRVDPATLRPEHDPDTFETNVPGLFVAGSVVAGQDANHIFIETGRFHGERIAQGLRRYVPIT